MRSHWAEGHLGLDISGLGLRIIPGFAPDRYTRSRIRLLGTSRRRSFRASPTGVVEDGRARCPFSPASGSADEFPSVLGRYYAKRHTTEVQANVLIWGCRFAQLHSRHNPRRERACQRGRGRWAWSCRAPRSMKQTPRQVPSAPVGWLRDRLGTAPSGPAARPTRDQSRAGARAWSSSSR